MNTSYSVMIDTNEIMNIGLKLIDWKRMPPDSAIHVKGKQIKKVLIAVDVTSAELILAKNLGCDAVIAHHPLGSTALNFYKVFDRHIEFMLEHGVPKDKAEDIVKKMKDRIKVKSHAHIYTDVVSTARILGMPLVNIHQPCDEYMRRRILDKIKTGYNDLVLDIVKSIEEIPEFRNSDTRIEVCYGSKKNKIGRWALVIAAGTNGGFPIAKAYFEYGISTVIYLHIDYNDLTKIYEEKLKGNLIILGHLAGDSIGLNALGDKLEEKGLETVRLGIIPSN
ncbi:MAG TPA: Nif3-like dinuclear metal center hexameric protein [Nitrososphaeraceae archaeon]|nr:Nif3-like dinuclear metal center hexameric protein [Nitrososphaeraceae archaeon]